MANSTDVVDATRVAVVAVVRADAGRGGITAAVRRYAKHAGSPIRSESWLGTGDGKPVGMADEEETIRREQPFDRRHDTPRGPRPPDRSKVATEQHVVGRRVLEQTWVKDARLQKANRRTDRGFELVAPRMLGKVPRSETEVRTTESVGRVNATTPNGQTMGADIYGINMESAGRKPRSLSVMAIEYGSSPPAHGMLRMRSGGRSKLPDQCELTYSRKY